MSGPRVQGIFFYYYSYYFYYCTKKSIGYQSCEPLPSYYSYYYQSKLKVVRSSITEILESKSRSHSCRDGTGCQ